MKKNDPKMALLGPKRKNVQKMLICWKNLFGKFISEATPAPTRSLWIKPQIQMDTIPF